MEIWGVGAVLALWRYLANIEWNLKIRGGRRRPKPPKA
jgi:hypothetical protein